ncbi:MAG: hypothetical protein AB7U61_04860 [Methylocystis sp.]|jgi:hypothetical protein
MSSLAYVIIPTTFASRQAAFEKTLALRSRCTIPTGIPARDLAFDDLTHVFRRIHRTLFDFKAAAGEAVRTGNAYHVDAETNRLAVV